MQKHLITHYQNRPQAEINFIYILFFSNTDVDTLSVAAYNSLQNFSLLVYFIYNASGQVYLKLPAH